MCSASQKYDWVMRENFINIMVTSQCLEGGQFLNRWRNRVSSRQGAEKQQEWRPSWKMRSGRPCSCYRRAEDMGPAERDHSQLLSPGSSQRKRKSLGNGLSA